MKTWCQDGKPKTAFYRTFQEKLPRHLGFKAIPGDSKPFKLISPVRICGGILHSSFCILPSPVPLFSLRSPVQNAFAIIWLPATYDVPRTNYDRIAPIMSKTGVNNTPKCSSVFIRVYPWLHCNFALLRVSA